MQHVTKPTIVQGADEPHILDIVFSNEPTCADFSFSSYSKRYAHV